jgi:diguanylate cyclase (GGDEF)-like protein/PAS domain S-box-containing protein
MRSVLPRPRLCAFAVAAAGAAGLFVAAADWPQLARSVEVTILLLIAVFSSACSAQWPVGPFGAAMRPPCVVAFIALLLHGPAFGLAVATASALAQLLASRAGNEWRPEAVSRAAIPIAAIGAAAVVHSLVGEWAGHLDWPWQAMPLELASAIAAYCIVAGVGGGLIVPAATGQPVDPSCLARIVTSMPPHVMGATVAVALSELIDHELWAALPAVFVPLAFCWEGYRGYLYRLEEDRRRKEVLHLIDEGMCVVNRAGQVTLWSDALARLSGCPRDRALGRSIADAVPALAASALPRSMQEVSSKKTGCAVQVELPATKGSRVLEVRIVPVSEGLSLLWRDVTERARVERTLKRSEERLALAAEGAVDGLWEWDLRTHEFYVSSRWRAMLGLSASAGIGRSDQWLGRVHAEDAVSLKHALDAHLTGGSQYFQHEHRLRHEDGSYRRFLCRGVAVRTSKRALRIAGSLTDTTERTLAQERLRRAGFLDSLTGLSNRALFVEGLGRRLDEFKQRRNSDRFAVLYLDVDRFKVVNDSLGHLVGDELLVAVSRRLEGCLRQGDSLARLGGDEFAILLNGLAEEQQANVIAFRIQEALSAPFSIGGREVFTSASIGIAIGLAQYVNPDEIMRDADTAMYQAKARGKARHEMFDADMHARARDRLGLENDLRHAVNSNDFEVHYQPIVSLASGMCVGFESLVRWKRNGEVISPATFIPIAEELGVIEQIGSWVMQQACDTFAGWQRRFGSAGLECITVNVSTRQLMQHNFLHIVEEAVRRSGLEPGALRIEITETALMDSPNQAAGVLQELRKFGVKIYLDDFGTGYSSLSHLHKLPVDALKIDRSFVRSLLLPDRPAIVESILALARTLNTSVVAEGIESDVQARELERLGCTHAQGYFFSRPLSIQSVEDLLQANQPLGPKPVDYAGAALADDPQLYFPTERFDWPKDIPA